MRLLLVIVLFGFAFSLSVRADDEKKNDSTWTQAKQIVPLKPGSPFDSSEHIDTTYHIPREVSTEAGLVSNPVNFEEHLTQQPTIGLFKSMLVPGWGQVGNRKYLKAGIIIGLESWLVSNAVHFGKQARDEKDRFEQETDPLLRDIYYQQYLDRRSQRNKYSWFLGLTIFASMFDAYVDAHLSGAPDQVKGAKVGFDIEPDISGGVSANLSISF